MDSVPAPTDTVRMLALVLGSLTIAPPLAATIDLSTRMVDCFQSMSLQRTAQASPRRMPVAAARWTKAPNRSSNSAAARIRSWTSATSGARTGSGRSDIGQLGSSVSATGLVNVPPLHLAASLQARPITTRTRRTVSLPAP